MTDEEHLRQMCMERIAMAQREYYEAIKPWVEQLARMESMSLRPITIRPNIDGGSTITIEVSDLYPQQV